MLLLLNDLNLELYINESLVDQLRSPEGFFKIFNNDIYIKDEDFDITIDHEQPKINERFFVSYNKEEFFKNFKIFNNNPELTDELLENIYFSAIISRNLLSENYIKVKIDFPKYLVIYIDNRETDNTTLTFTKYFLLKKIFTNILPYKFNQVKESKKNSYAVLFNCIYLNESLFNCKYIKVLNKNNKNYFYANNFIDRIKCKLTVNELKGLYDNCYISYDTKLKFINNIAKYFIL